VPENVGPKRIAETWNSFWGDLLLRRFHEQNSERWSARQEKADWVARTLSLRPGDRIVDLGCGDGVLDICLAKHGFHVAAVDRIASVLSAARKEAADRAVEVDFLVADLRTYPFGANTFDAAIFFDTLGLMGRDAELSMLSRFRQALAPQASLLIDWPRTGSNSRWERRFPEGMLKVVAEYDEKSRLQTIVPEFHRDDERVIELHDPYAPPDHRGIRRHIYAVEEAVALLEEAGYEACSIPHFRGEGYWMLRARPAGGSMRGETS
jgi:SAM-dependent methyltransferase